MSDEATPTARPMLTVVSGLSGSGKSVALRTLEDLDYYCVDNLPAELLTSFVQSMSCNGSKRSRLAVSIDVRNLATDLSRIGVWLSAVAELGYDHRLVFFDTRDEVLVKRYSETRRRHPLSHQGLPLSDAIALERQRLGPLRALADHVIDTTDLNVHQLRKAVLAELESGHAPRVSLLFESFAYKHGVPVDADFVFDARCLPNPHWDARLRPLSGRDGAVRDYLDEQDTVREYVAQVSAFLDTWLPRFESDTRSYVTIAFGCTGGRHRSVYLAEKLAAHCRSSDREDVLTYHRELE
ncbi:MAG TPA: RNase adapter RapZ [Arenimonas sp.]|uniref:RNase adapter RapZ n=1 Tax=Arenimonas sp. TaxID=1872635 RepID=UPI002CB517FD|nr:RNase adapter RapZ [Arenimonas sp.]HMB58251.1 RNase adapter RapZ [Arenimonas sp.]